MNYNRHGADASQVIMGQETAMARANAQTSKLEKKFMETAALHRTLRIALTGVSALALLTTGFATPVAFAAIDNTATAIGTFDAADDTVSAPDTASVPVANNPQLTIAKVVFTAPVDGADADTIVDGDDVIVYRYTVTNDGNVTETNVAINDAGPTFTDADANTVAGTGTLSAITEVTGVGAGTGTAASLAPGETVVFEASYTLSDGDAFQAAGVTDGVDNSATATADSGTVSPPGTAETTIPADTGLTIAKVAVLSETNGDTSDGNAEVNDTITYTYTVTNNGNVALTNVAVNDTHEGAPVAIGAGGINDETITTAGPLGNSDIGTANDGVIDMLAAGATATFTYIHTVTQAEVDNG